MQKKCNLKRGFALIFGALLLFSFFTGIGAAANWYQFQMDELNSGVTTDAAPIKDPVDEDYNSWEIQLPIDSDLAGIDSVPLVVDDLVYVATADNTVYAISKNTGDIEWNTSTSGNGFLLSTPAYGNGLIFVPTKDGYIYALDADDGDEEWHVKVSDKQLNTPVKYDDHRIYFGDCATSGIGSSGNGTYYCYDDDGNECWTRVSTSGSGYYWAGAAIKGDYLVYGDDGSHLTSVDKDNGDTIDEIDVSDVFDIDVDEIRSSVLYHDGKVYFTSKDGYCFSIGFNSGSFDTDSTYKKNIGKSTSTPVIYKDRLYAGNENGLICLDSSDLSEIWLYDTDEEVQSSPALSSHYDAGNGDIYIYFTTNAEDGKIYCLKDHEGNTGPQMEWLYGESGKTDWSLAGVAISDGWLYYGTDQKYLFGLTNEEKSSQNSGSDASSGGGSGSGDTGEPDENIASVDSCKKILSIGNRAVFDFPEEEICIKSVSFDPKVNAGYKTTTVEVLKDVSTYAEPIDGNVYSYVNVWVGKAGFATSKNLENAKITFKIPESWIDENDIDTSTITLNRYNQGAWEKLDTKRMKKIDSETEFGFVAKTSGFSSFVITAEKKVTENANQQKAAEKTNNSGSQDDFPEKSSSTDEQQPEQSSESAESTPGFGSLLMCIGLLASVYCLRRNNKL
jgi:PGF-pre-PGF domain-containing protein